MQQAQKEIIKLRETEEKQRRAREAREKADAERLIRAERKRALVDMNAHETQEGVMDSLMEALQTGSAFSRPDQRRKRQTRAAGGKSSSRLRTRPSVLFAAGAHRVAARFKRNLKQPQHQQQQASVISEPEVKDVIKEEFEEIVRGIEALVDRDGVGGLRRRANSLDSSTGASRPVVGKGHKRTAFVRQVVVKRRRTLAVKVKSHRPGKYLGCPSDANVTLPSAVVACSSNSGSSNVGNRRLSVSCNDLPSNVDEVAIPRMIAELVMNERNKRGAVLPDENENTLSVSLEKSNEADESVGGDDSSASRAASGENYLERSTRKLRRLFTFRSQKLLTTSAGDERKDGGVIGGYAEPEREAYRKPVSWKLWRGTRSTGKCTITPDDRCNK